jgi:hypothetical protein
MGAGIAPNLMRQRKYRALKRVERDLNRQGIPCGYENLEVRGNNFVVYFAGCGPASNGESFSWLVLRFNPKTKPLSTQKRPGDVNYTDFHTRDIPEFDRGGYEAGVKAINGFLGLVNWVGSH